MSHYQAAVYRNRAAHLRALATKMTNTPAMTLHLHAGVDTWHGPRAFACVTDLRTAQRAVEYAIADLHTEAGRFEATADRLEAAAFAVESAAAAAAENAGDRARRNVLPPSGPTSSVFC
ncbi:MAG: hypothetical protein ACJAXA_001650 [Candidatus Aldehydirespiratoraceae bacterium]|jgi:hypothetical protein